VKGCCGDGEEEEEEEEKEEEADLSIGEKRLYTQWADAGTKSG